MFQKIKKTHGPDFENPLKLRSVNKENKSEDPTCDFCSCSAKSNREGVYEQLLTCKDCNAKGMIEAKPSVSSCLCNFLC